MDAWEVYLKCPSCRKKTTRFDLHENLNSEREEVFCVLDRKDDFTCPCCGQKTRYDTLLTKKYAKVEDLRRYKRMFLKDLVLMRDGRNVYYSDWDPSVTEELALERLTAMYPRDRGLRKIRMEFECRRRERRRQDEIRRRRLF